MDDQGNRKILELIEIAVISTLILTRFFIASDENTWISLLNYMGLVIAVVSLYTDIRRQCFKYKKIDLITGIFVIVIIVIAVIAGLIFAEIIILNTKYNDIISLFTLLITLPVRLYISIIKEAIKD